MYDRTEGIGLERKLKLHCLYSFEPHLIVLLQLILCTQAAVPGLLNDKLQLFDQGNDDADGDDETRKDLRSRGLCLVPVSFTMHVGSDNGADLWAAALGGGF